MSNLPFIKIISKHNILMLYLYFNPALFVLCTLVATGLVSILTVGLYEAPFVSKLENYHNILNNF